MQVGDNGFEAVKFNSNHRLSGQGLSCFLKMFFEVLKFIPINYK
jgi:hypothetical protein